MGAPFFVEEFPSSLEAMGATLQRALTSLKEHDWIEEEQCFYAHLCLEEALVNAITHGNQNDASRRVRLEMYEEGDTCHIRVRDEGAGFEVENIPDPGCEQIHGRGICLIRYCMEDVHYNRAERCLDMTMRRKGLCKGGART